MEDEERLGVRRAFLPDEDPKTEDLQPAALVEPALELGDERWGDTRKGLTHLELQRAT
jgi:hypothetical protein